MQSLRIVSLTLCSLALLAPTPQPATETWEKVVAPGFMFRMDVNHALPRTIVSVRMTPQANGVAAIPALPGKTVFDASPTVGRGTVSQFVEQYEAFGGVNADFFPFSSDRATGDPLGFMAVDGELISAPGRPRSTFAWGPEISQIGVVAMTASLQVANGTPIRISGVNEECPLNGVTLNSSVAGLALSKAPNVHVTLAPTTAKIPLDGTVTAKVIAVGSGSTSVPVPLGQWVLQANGTAGDQVKGLTVGTDVTVSIKCTGFDWSKTPNAVGGGPTLLSNGANKITAKQEGFPDSFSVTRHPRTAVGRTKSGDIWWVVVDGRSKHSVGASLEELAEIMRRLDCVDAINLDGGGSSAMVLGGTAVNHPSSNIQRAVANGVVFKIPTVSDNPVKSIKTERKGAEIIATAIGADGQPLPNARVIWSCSGNAWIDQAGTVRSLADGPIKVYAWCGGNRVETTVTLNAK